MHIHVLQHEDHEGPGHIGDWAKARGRRLRIVDARAGIEAAPADVGFLIVLGGALNVDEEAGHAWLAPEKAFIRAIVSTGVPILGICLGSQLLAEALGAAVRRNPVAEIGWHPVSFDDRALAAQGLGALPRPARVLEWHGQTFDIPPGAIRLAGGPWCANQMFAHQRRCVGLQFHPEWTHDIVMSVAKNEPYTANGTNMQTLDAVMAGDFTATRPFLFALLDHLASRAGARP